MKKKLTLKLNLRSVYEVNLNYINYSYFTIITYFRRGIGKFTKVNFPSTSGYEINFIKTYKLKGLSGNDIP